ncbi:gag-pol polyprotein [Tanacetum coccineum]
MANTRRYREYDLAHLKLVFEFCIYRVWSRCRYGSIGLLWIRRIDHVSFVVFGEYRHRYAVSSLMNTAYWLSEQQEGIKRQVTTTYTPQQNGVVERMNRTLLERARAMLATASLEKSFCAKAVNTTCYVINRSPSITVKLKTLMEM